MNFITEFQNAITCSDYEEIRNLIVARMTLEETEQQQLPFTTKFNQSWLSVIQQTNLTNTIIQLHKMVSNHSHPTELW